MKTVIIPDIHLKTSFATRIINSEGADEVVLLGDVFDNYDDSPEENKRAAEWLNNILDDNRIIYLHSNHDCNYIGNNLDTACKGYTREKKTAIRSVLRSDIRSKVRYFHISQNVLFSHGGLHNSHIPYLINNDGLNAISEFLNSEIKYADRYLYDRIGKHWIFEAGYCRSGRAPFGGLLWSDFYREFTHVKGLTQICGHTCPPSGGREQIPHFRIQDKNNFNEYEVYTVPKVIDGTWSCGLDCHLAYYGVISNGLFKVCKYSDL